MRTITVKNEMVIERGPFFSAFSIFPLSAHSASNPMAAYKTSGKLLGIPSHRLGKVGTWPGVK